MTHCYASSRVALKPANLTTPHSREAIPLKTVRHHAMPGVLPLAPYAIAFPSARAVYDHGHIGAAQLPGINVCLNLVGEGVKRTVEPGDSDAALLTVRMMRTAFDGLRAWRCCASPARHWCGCGYPHAGGGPRGMLPCVEAKATGRQAAFQPIETVLLSSYFKAQVAEIAARLGGTLVCARPVAETIPLAAG